MQRFFRSKLFIAMVIVLIVLVLGVVLFFTASEYAHFKHAKDEALSIAGEIRSNKNYFIIDTKRSQIDLDAMTSFQQSLHFQAKAKAIEAIKSTNHELGFDDSLYQHMSITTSLMGTQRQENESYIVTWSYSPNEGLEVKYQIKASAMFKLGGD